MSPMESTELWKSKWDFEKFLIPSGKVAEVSITCDVAKRRYSCELSKLLTDTIQGQHIYNIDLKHFRAIETHLMALEASLK